MLILGSPHFGSPVCMLSRTCLAIVWRYIDASWSVLTQQTIQFAINTFIWGWFNSLWVATIIILFLSYTVSFCRFKSLFVYFLVICHMYILIYYQIRSHFIVITDTLYDCYKIFVVCISQVCTECWQYVLLSNIQWFN